jgi:hypothetical protein
MKKLNTRGFSHHLLLLGIVLTVAVGGVFTMVLKAHNSKASEQTAKSSTTKGKLTTKTKTESGLKLVNTGTADKPATPTIAAGANSSTSKKSSGSSSSTSSGTNIGSGSSTPSSPAAPVITPLSALTSIISGLQNGTVQATVPAGNVTVPGPISDAQARPIVFTVNGQRYFAYTQGSKPDFSLSASQLANSMALVPTSTNPSLVWAYIDKAGFLTAYDLSGYVGFSTGGN